LMKYGNSPLSKFKWEYSGDDNDEDSVKAARNRYEYFDDDESVNDI